MNGDTHFGHWLKERRKHCDLTQHNLAERVGCAVVTIRKIEAGTLRPSEQVAERLAQALAVPAEQVAQVVAFACRPPVNDALDSSSDLAEHSLFVGREAELSYIARRME